jgi:DNA-binding transcriptional MocR family regulator
VGNAMSNGSFSKIIAPGVRVGWAEATPSFTLALSQVSATRSGGCPAHITASFVHEMLDSGSLETHLQTQVLPKFRALYYSLLQAIDDYLVPLGMKISTGKPYTKSSGRKNGTQNGHKDAIAQAGGYFFWLLLHSYLAGKGAVVASKGLEKHDLQFAYGDMMQVQVDHASAERGAQGYENGVRLSWAWHTETEIVEGIKTLAKLIEEARKKL